MPWLQEGEIRDQVGILKTILRVVLVEGEVEEQASINRSPTSYDANPEEERAR